MRAWCQQRREAESEYVRNREKVIQSLEGIYREAYAGAESASDESGKRELDFGFQRDQVFLEVLLDLRDALSSPQEADESKDPSLLERAKAVRKFTKLGGL